MVAVPLLDVRNLTVGFRSRRHSRLAVRDLSFSVAPGEVLAIVGESGSGKSVTALSLMRLIEREGGRIESGSIRFRRHGDDVIDLAGLDERHMRAIRGNLMSMVFQEPMTSLNPVLTIGDQLMETLIEHRRLGFGEARRLAVGMLERVRISDPERRIGQYPHELSGGMRQRVMIAIALACAPKLLIADEPTTALDVTIQAGILDLIRTLREDTGTAVIFITHDMGVVAELADRVVVMRDGERVETAPTRELFARPQAAYTRALLDAVPRLGSGAPVYAAPALQMEAVAPPPVLEVENLVTRFPVRKGPFRRLVAEVHAVDNVSLHLDRGETLGLVGESGSGKSTIGRSILKLVEPTSGRIVVGGRDVTRLGRDAMRPVRRSLQMVFQDPYASLDPRMSIADLVTEPLAIHSDMRRAERRERAVELLRRVGLDPDSLDRFPHQFSGGQRQRICIARALSSRPDIIVADEPVSALDVSVQARVIELLRELQQEYGIAYLFISHDLAVVERMSHRVAVLDQGRIVETGPTGLVLADPKHAYTKELVAAVPVADPARGRRLLMPVPQRKSPVRPLGWEPPVQRYVSLAGERLVAAD
ncbi:ABC transporter ATP-binding protein [Mesorhizobium sp. L-8-3]|uniref:ABC transporter ATP-binding protein n=1 Tax=Mesorhizobium sp. L-8-3 TaxID=2744522 RepID=UPI001928E611|nr:ABC transporter ATP-binding protein [Mesorhizobium sp. L-8-3]BCH27545.1 ABC transporter ATP-binding protein [Mesorhizobium sp. L-8-3]